jgi:PEP-CTERM/exosortase A-associated glycosyltransferase
VRILHLLDHSLPLQSGYSFRTIGILAAQRKRGWDTVQMTTPKQYKFAGAVDRVDGWTFYRTPQPAAVTQKLPLVREACQMWATGRRLDEVIEETRPDILQAHSPVLNGLPALRAARRHGLPMVYEMRSLWEDAAVDWGTARQGDLRYRATRGLETYVLRRADAVFTICEGLRGDILGRGIAADRVTVVPNAVNVEQFTTERRIDGALRRRLGLEGCVVLGFIGSFYAYEGLDLLLEACARLFRERANVKLLMVGGGPEKDRLVAQAAELGIAERVIFSGRVPHDQVRRFYDLVTLFVYPRHRMRLTDLVTPLKPLATAAPTTRAAHRRSLGMGMRRLSIIDLAGGHQPISPTRTASSPIPNAGLVCNGEIYNFRELRAELQALGHALRHRLGLRGAAAPLRAHWGDAFLAPERHVRLRAVGRAAPAPAARPRPARHQAALRAQTAGRLAFATEAKALLALPGSVHTGASTQRAARLPARWATWPAPLSMFEGIRKLPPATLLVGEDGRCEERRYWRCRRRWTRAVTEASGSRRCARGIERSVRMQMVSDVPIGAFLSGGVDSSAVVGFMARHSESAHPTYAIGFEGGAAEALYNELPYARQVAQRFGTEHHEIVVKPDVVGLLPKLLWHMDEPVADTAFVTTYLVSSEFARRDVKVILSGWAATSSSAATAAISAATTPASTALPGLAAPCRGAPRPHALPATATRRWLNSRAGHGLPRSADLPVRRALPQLRAGVSAPRRLELLLRQADDAGAPDALGAGLRRASGDDRSTACSRSTPMTQLPDDLLLLTDKMSMAVLAGVPRAAARPRTGGAGRAHARVKVKIAAAQPEAPDEGRCRPCCRATSWSARSAASARRWARG